MCAHPRIKSRDKMILPQSYSSTFMLFIEHTCVCRVSPVIVIVGLTHCELKMRWSEAKWWYLYILVALQRSVFLSRGNVQLEIQYIILRLLVDPCVDLTLTPMTLTIWPKMILTPDDFSGVNTTVQKLYLYSINQGGDDVAPNSMSLY